MVIQSSFVDDGHLLTDTAEPSEEGSSLQSWISWFCSLPEHEFYVEVPEDFIEDDFNLTGLSALVPYYRKTLDVILDIEPEDEESDDEVADGLGRPADPESHDDGLWKEGRFRINPSNPPNKDHLEEYAFQLYGLIHQRYLLTRNGLRLMAERFAEGQFGVCPRTLCDPAALCDPTTPSDSIIERANVIPCGRFEEMGREKVRMYCPRCKDLYTAPSRFENIDGAHFGGTYPHLLFLTYPELLLEPPEQIYEPRIFGFRVNELSPYGPRMQWLRLFSNADEDEDDLDGQEEASYGMNNGESEMIGESVPSQAVEGRQENDPALTRLTDQTETWQLGAVSMLRRWL